VLSLAHVQRVPKDHYTECTQYNCGQNKLLSELVGRVLPGCLCGTWSCAVVAVWMHNNTCSGTGSTRYCGRDQLYVGMLDDHGCI